MKKIIFLFILSCFIWFLPAGILVQEQEVQAGLPADLLTEASAQAGGLPKVGLLPDSPFYFLKTWKESIQLFFTFGAENKTKQFLHLSEVRLAEYQKMIEKGKTEIAKKTLEKYEKQLGQALEKAEEAKEKGKDVERLTELISEKVLKHQEVLLEVYEKAPEQAKEGIEKAFESSQKGLEKAIEVITPEEKEIPKEIPKKIEEKPTTLCQPDTRHGYAVCSDLSKESVVQPESKYCGPLPAQVVAFIEECKAKDYKPAPMLSYNKNEKGCITQCCSCGPLVLKEEESAPGQGIIPAQKLTEGAIGLGLEGLEEDIKNYLISWYNEFYLILENITGGPCKPFKANVIYSSSGSGGTFKSSSLGGDANLIFNMPLDRSKAYDANFDSRFGHEFTHGFLNGVRAVGVTPSGKSVTASFITEGSTEMAISSALLEMAKRGRIDYKEIHYYLPYVLASYDSYAIEGKNTAGGTLMWKGDGTGFYYIQGEAVWYLLEQAKPGFFKEFMKEVCSLPQKQEGSWDGIYLFYDKFKEILSKIFGSEKIEGKPILEWFNSQPITNTEGEAGNYIRVQFRGKDINREGRSINPGSLLITAVNRIIGPEGPTDSSISISPSIRITDWQGKVTEVKSSGGNPASAIIPQLSPGAYKAEVSDNNLKAETITYFIVTSAVDEDSLYGIKLNNGEIVNSGTIKTSLGDVQITNGFFAIKVLENIKEVNFPDNNRIVIKPVGMARMIIVP